MKNNCTHLIVKELPVRFVESFMWSQVQVACGKALSPATKQTDAGVWSTSAFVNAIFPLAFLHKSV